ncbi:hypothetical protein Bca52824_080162 [Brassica carinata]|uniref:Uncharacterized protein n=1 Tax=Brassica carinata TaxID=52824 RepID=A0A8X7Q2R5_BRACI|nr:hypothetical protein Bca52824_080162 [Brassica carinata]
MEEYSASATTVAFDRPIPLLRGPIPSSREEGARIGSRRLASNNCKPPWWRSLGGGGVVDMREREKCEEREFKECLAAKNKCSGFAKEKCSAAFLDARIAMETDVEGLIWLASIPEDSRWLGSLVQARRKTNRRARDVLLNQQQ